MMENTDQYFLWNGEQVSGPFTRNVIVEWLAENGSPSNVKVAQAGTEDWKAPQDVFPVPPPIPKAGPPPLPRSTSAEERGNRHSVTIEVDAHEELWAEAIDAELKRAGLDATVELTGPEMHGGNSSAQAIGPTDQPPIQKSADSAPEVFDSGDFFGEAVKSLSGQFTIAWNGEEYRLLDGERVVAKGRGQGFGPGKVTDQGIAVLAKISDKGRGTLFALMPSGKKIFEKTFTGPVDGLDITPCGTSAVCVGFDKGATSLMRVDLLQGRLSSLTELVHDGIVGSVRFGPDKKIIEVYYERRGPVHHYAMDGTFLDSEKWSRERTRHMDGYELLVEAETRMSEHGDGPYNYEVLDLLRRALQHKVSPLTRAKIHRRLGEVIARTGDHGKAVAHLESALKLDPKIGVKRLLNKLKSSEPS